MHGVTRVPDEDGGTLPMVGLGLLRYWRVNSAKRQLLEFKAGAPAPELIVQHRLGLITLS